MPMLNLTEDEPHAVFSLCSEETEIALCDVDADSGLLHLGVMHKCFLALRPETPPSIVNGMRIGGEGFLYEWPQGVA